MSYSRTDKVTAEAIKYELEKHGHHVWIDLAGIPTGTNWSATIDAAIMNADTILLLLSPESVLSSAVNDEIRKAKKSRKKIIPIVIKEVNIPADLDKMGISDVQVIDFWTLGLYKGLERLLNDIAPQRSTFEVLIIEDVMAQKESISALLEDIENAEFKIKWADSYGSALMAIRSQQFDLITLDMQLDMLDQDGQQGIELLGQISVFQKQCSVIIVSAVKFTALQMYNFMKDYNLTVEYQPKPWSKVPFRQKIKQVLSIS